MPIQEYNYIRKGMKGDLHADCFFCGNCLIIQDTLVFVLKNSQSSFQISIF